MMRGSILFVTVLAVLGCHEIPMLEPPVDEADRAAFFNAVDGELQAWERLEAEGRHQEAMMQGRRIGWIVLQNRPFIEEALVSANEGHRAVAAGAVAFSDEPAFNAQLRACLASPDPRVVANALTSLGQLRYPYVDPRQAAAFLGSPEPSVRAAAAFYLGRTMTEAADEEVIAPLLRATTDPDVSVRTNAVAALGELGDPLAIRALTDRLTADPDPRVRIAAAKALGKIGGDEAAAALMGSLERQGDVEAKRVTFAALEAATGQGFGRDEAGWWKWWQDHLAGRPTALPPTGTGTWEPARPGPERPTDPTRLEPRPSPEGSGTAEPRPGPGPGPEPGTEHPRPGPGPGEPVRPGVPADLAASLFALENGSLTEKARAESDLVAMGSRALPEILARLETGEEAFSLRLLSIVHRIGDRSVLAELKRIGERPNLVVRLSALDAIWALAGPAELAFYEGALADRWAKVRRKAARFVLDSGSPKGIPVFIEALESDDLLVRGHAIEVLRDATGQNFGFDGSAPEPARREAVLRWKEWWEVNGASFTLPR